MGKQKVVATRKIPTPVHNEKLCTPVLRVSSTSQEHELPKINTVAKEDPNV